MGNKIFRNTQSCGARLETTVHSPFLIWSQEGMTLSPSLRQMMMGFLPGHLYPLKFLGDCDISVQGFHQHHFRALISLVVHAG